MYGIDSGNGYVYGEDESASSAHPSSADGCSTCADTCPEQAIELSMNNSAPSGASPDNL